MTRAESIIAAGAKKLAAIQSLNQFTIDGCSAVFSGSVTEDTYSSELGAGGLAITGALSIVAAADQFTEAGCVPAVGGAVFYNGARWTIDATPNVHTAPGVVRLLCSNPSRR